MAQQQLQLVWAAGFVGGDQLRTEVFCLLCLRLRQFALAGIEVS
ncbi:hypothetical protein [Simiduia agarivorans]|nr:hypothetical protein [Simiduia agarivorans]